MHISIPPSPRPNAPQCMFSGQHQLCQLHASFSDCLCCLAMVRNNIRTSLTHMCRSSARHPRSLAASFPWSDDRRLTLLPASQCLHSTDGANSCSPSSLHYSWQKWRRSSRSSPSRYRLWKPSRVHGRQRWTRTRASS